MKSKLPNASRYVISFVLLVAIVAVVGRANAADVSLNRQGEEIIISAGVQTDFAGSEASITAPDTSTIEVQVGGADFSVEGKRQLFRFEDGTVKTVSVSRENSSGVLRFNVLGKNAGLVADAIRMTRSDGNLYLSIPTSVDSTGIAISGTKVVSISPGPTKVEAASEATSQTTVASALIGGSGDVKSEAPMITSEVKDKRPESEIPVFSDKATVKKADGSGLERLVITLFVACVLLAGTLYGVKRWAARRTKNIASPTKIQILTQHHLGPKKSLAIIQVAGEAILIGITDQNISMLKTLALIDDEVPGHVPKNFSDELEGDASDVQRHLEEEGFETDNFALKGLSEVRDMVSTRFGKSSRRDS